MSPSKGHVVVVGAGTAGNAAARTLVEAGWRVTQADPDRWGGTCLWRGCIPKKSLYQSSRTMRAVVDAEQFGIRCDDASIDWQAVLGWKWHSQESYAGDQEANARSRGIEVVKTAARFLSPDSIDVGGDVLKPDHFVVATGSEAILPPIPGIELADTSDIALRYSELPASLAIVGGGFIAMEFAGIFAGLGTKVTVITQADRVLEMLDEDLSAAAVQRLRGLGVTFVTSATVGAIEGSSGALRVVTSHPSEPESSNVERVLVAIGRKPRLDDLGLDLAAVEIDARGHAVLDSSLRSTNPSIWFAGDASGGMMQTPIANYEGRTVAHSIDSGAPEHPDCSNVPTTCFTIPQLATVGLTEKDAEAQGVKTKVKRIAFGSVGAGIIAAETDGFVKLVTDSQSGRILGCQIAADSASDLIYSAAVAMKAGMTGEDLGNVIAVHPSFAEAVSWSG